MAGTMVREVVRKSKRKGLNSGNFLKTVVLIMSVLLE